MPTIAGVYCITNRLNGKIYVGSSMNIASRWSAHRKAKDSNTAGIARAIRKYGADAFLFEIVEVVFTTGLTRSESRILILESEQRWLIALHPFHQRGYNMSYLARCPNGLNYSVEYRTKLSNRLRGHPVTAATRKKIRIGLLGRSRPPEVVEKMRQASIGIKQSQETIARRVMKLRGQKRTPEAKEKMRQAALLREQRKRSNETNGEKKIALQEEAGKLVIA